MLICFGFSLLASVNILKAQVCSGTWALQRPLTSQCVVGQWVGWQNMTEPIGCPINPIYTGVQTNTFTFTNPVSGFSIDFKGLDGNSLCARMEIKVNGVFYPLTALNLVDFPTGSTCTTGSFSFMTLTSDGYITTSILGGQGFIAQGRIIINNVNATNITVSTNDGFGTTFSNPFNCLDIVPLRLESFTGKNTVNCKAMLNFKTGTESNIKNIEMQRSEDGIVYKKIGVVSPKGSNSQYSFITDNFTDGFFRLRIDDQDGTYQYSEIIKIKTVCNNSNYNISPNPGNVTIKVSGLMPDDCIIIFDIASRKLMTFNPPLHTNQIAIQQIPVGIYILQVINNGAIKTFLKFIKN